MIERPWRPMSVPATTTEALATATIRSLAPRLERDTTMDPPPRCQPHPPPQRQYLLPARERGRLLGCPRRARPDRPIGIDTVVGRAARNEPDHPLTPLEYPHGASRVAVAGGGVGRPAGRAEGAPGHLPVGGAGFDRVDQAGDDAVHDVGGVHPHTT